MSPVRLLARVLVVPVAGAAVALAPGFAHAAPATCNFVSGSVGITMSFENARVFREPDGTIKLQPGFSAPLVCGGATVFNASTVAIGGMGGTLRVDLGNGGFVPGSAGETDGLSEIEFVLNSSGIGVEIAGGPNADFLARAATGGLHLNADADQDFAFNAPPASLAVLGGDGDDFVDLSRGNGNGNQPFPARIEGGNGNDVLRGDVGDDHVLGGAGHDEISAGLGSDGAVAGNEGNDLLLATKNNLEPTFDGASPIPDEGSVTSRIFVNGLDFAQDLELRMTITHPDTSTLTVALLPRGFGDPFVLATGRPGLGFYGTLFDDSAATKIADAPGGGTYAARYRPEGGLLASLIEQSPAGAWEIQVTDNAADGQTGTLVSWALHVAGAKMASSSTSDGTEQYDGGDGTDVLRYGSRIEPVTVTATSATGGTAGEDLENDTYAAVESVEGGLGHDVFHGSADADTFSGGQGGDRFLPGPGDDTIDCGDFFDNDVLDYSALAAGVQVDLAGGTAVAEGTDSLKGCDDVVGTEHADVISGTDSRNVLVGNGGDDVIDGLGGGDELSDGAGEDTVDAGAGESDYVYSAGDGVPDTFAGGDGPGDRFFAGGSSGGVVVILDGLPNDGVSGENDDVGADFENVHGTELADVLVGSDLANEIVGGGGNDTIDGAGGDDTLSGADGTDTLSFASSPAGVTASFLASTATGDGSDVAFEFENLRGSAFGDVLTGDDGPNVVEGGAGDDVVATLGGDDRLLAAATADGGDSWTPGDGTDTADYSLRTAGVAVTLDDEPNDGLPGEGDDVPNGVEVVQGGAGGDAIVGGLEANTFRGGPGNDTLLGRGGPDTLYGEAGDDAVIGSSGNDLVEGGDGNDSVTGGEGDDRLRGGVGNDTLLGGLGDDDEFGEDGNDRFVQGDTATVNGSDLLVGGAGTDTVTYSGRSGAVTVDVDAQFDDGQAFEQDNVTRDVEVVEGTAYHDVLTGNELANTLRGLGGNDRLTGLAGNDALDGGSGNDTFAEGVVQSGRDTFVGGTGVDHVDYAARTAAVRVDLDNAADDGGSGEADNVRSDVENVTGGAGSDVLTGSSAANRLLGGAGNDTITGGTGRDTLDGGSGNDTLHARDAARDSVTGGSGTDRARRDSVDAVSGVESFF